MPRKLKVFRTPIGFHDAYVAAPSQKAALAVWGSDANLFARGAADEVTDPALMKAPLASPGTVIRVARGTAEEHMAALPPAKASPPQSVESKSEEGKSRASKPKTRPKPKPRPSREALDRAEAALEDVERRSAADQRQIADKEAALAREKEKLRADHRRDVDRLDKERSTADDRYRRAMSEWQNEP